ncbi:unnamed protein product [Owenia fusiformis]|uniref:Uncharacterized protein n=1 Tax=Owenia fusiformis TaxID=6347 RepID=A0A8J1TYS0_OWEFU|nr:unnamed protein product [Owenia fusiformis]
MELTYIMIQLYTMSLTLIQMMSPTAAQKTSNFLDKDFKETFNCKRHMGHQIHRCMIDFLDSLNMYQNEKTTDFQRYLLRARLCREYEMSLMCLHTLISSCQSNIKTHLPKIQHKLGKVRPYMDNECHHHLFSKEKTRHHDKPAPDGADDKPIKIPELDFENSPSADGIRRKYPRRYDTTTLFPPIPQQPRLEGFEDSTMKPNVQITNHQKVHIHKLDLKHIDENRRKNIKYGKLGEQNLLQLILQSTTDKNATPSINSFSNWVPIQKEGESQSAEDVSNVDYDYNNEEKDNRNNNEIRNKPVEPIKYHDGKLILNHKFLHHYFSSAAKTNSYHQLIFSLVLAIAISVVFIS